MTFLTKSSLEIKKAPLINDDNCDEEVIDIPPSMWVPVKRSPVSLVCITLGAVLVAFIGISTGFMLYRYYMRGAAIHRYQGFCSIPISAKSDPALIEPNFRVMPLRWTSDPDVQVFSTVDEDTSDDFVSTLQEQLEIADNIEKISVTDNGQAVNFIHDFNANLSGIADPDRCYMMELDPDVVLSPGSFVLHIERGAMFEVSPIRAEMRAALPALSTLSRAAVALYDACQGKPVYRLDKDKETPVAIRKRSADAPAHDYIQFAGRHVQEIEIKNLAELLEYEQKIKNEAA